MHGHFGGCSLQAAWCFSEHQEEGLAGMKDNGFWTSSLSPLVKIAVVSSYVFSIPVHDIRSVDEDPVAWTLGVCSQ